MCIEYMVRFSETYSIFPVKLTMEPKEAIKMKRNGMLLLVLILLLVTAAVAEGTGTNPDLATPTDLICAHENTKEYVFYENPDYIRLDYQSHKVIGYDAVVRTVCLDCGEVLSEETRDQVEEVRGHVFRNGTCAMCGCQQPIVFMIYTQEDIEKRIEKQEETLLLRPEGSSMAVAIPMVTLHDILEKNPGKTFRAELQPHPDGSFYAVLVLIEDNAEPKPFLPEGAEIRYYTRNDTPTMVYTPKEGAVRETETEFVDNSTPSQRYWTTPFIGNGTYKP